MKTIAILLIAAAGVAAMLFGRPQEEAPEQQEPALEDDEASEAETMDAPEDEVVAVLPGETECRAEIVESCREMNPLTLLGGSRITFLCEDGEKRKFFIDGDNGVYLQAGERGVLTYRNTTFICFEKENGDLVGAMYFVDGAEG